MKKNPADALMMTAGFFYRVEYILYSVYLTHFFGKYLLNIIKI